MKDATEFVEKGRRCTCREHGCHVPHDECECGCSKAVPADATEFVEKGQGATLAALEQALLAYKAHESGAGLKRHGHPRKRIRCLDHVRGLICARWGRMVGAEAAEGRTNVLLRPNVQLTPADLDRIARAEV